MSRVKYLTEEERSQAKKDAKRRWREKHPEYNKQYYEANKEKLLEQDRQYYKDNYEKIKNYRIENREKRNKYTKEWHNSHKEHEENYRKEHREERLEYLKEYNKIYYQTNKEKVLERKKNYSNTLRGWANAIVGHCIAADKKSKRIGNDLPKDYIDTEWTMEKIQNGCTYKDDCGTTDWRKIGLNRIDNSLPHIKSNCEPCCWKCNQKLNVEEMSIPIIEVKEDGTIIEWGSVRKCMNAIGKSKGLLNAINDRNNNGHFYKTSQFYKKSDYEQKLLEELEVS